MESEVNLSLEACNLVCFRGDSLLFQGLSFQLKSGQVMQIEGGNGRGKTTLLRILCGLSPVDEGQIKWCGVPLGKARASLHAQLAWVGHRDGIKDELTPLENLSAARSLSEGYQQVDSSSVLASLGLIGRDDVPCRNLSAGQRRRVALARLSVSTAKLWVLDEPLTALDVAGREALQKMMVNHAQNGGMVVYTTHQKMPLDGCDHQAVVLA